LSDSKEPERKKIKMSDNIAASNYIELAADIVSAYVSNNSVPSGDLPTLISDVHSALLRVGGGTVEVPVEAPKPAIPVKKSVTPDYIVCLEDGKKFKSLKRHLRTQYNMTPEQYREKWALPVDYPMVAPNYAKARSELAKEMGLGQQRRKRRSSRLTCPRPALLPKRTGCGRPQGSCRAAPGNGGEGWLRSRNRSHWQCSRWNGPWSPAIPVRGPGAP
jgi:predicted transcriptional regulator